MDKEYVTQINAEERFDTCIDRLRSIVEMMEQGNINLEESLKLFEEGIGVSRNLFRILNSAEGRVEELLNTMEKVAFDKEQE